MNARQKPNLSREVTASFLRIVDDSAVADTIVAPPVLTPPADEPDVGPARSWLGRGFALLLLAATLAGLGWLAVQLVHVGGDAWIAPLHLSPDSDAVAALRLQHQRHLAELARLDVEVTRIDGELEAIDAAVARLSTLRGSAQATLTWQAHGTSIEETGLRTSTDLLRRQRDLTHQLYRRQQQLVARAREDLAAGIIDRTAVDREEQVLDQLALERTALQRQLTETKVRRKHNRAALEALLASTGAGDVGPTPGQMPEVAAGDEHSARVEIEIQRLLAEARGQRALRAAAIANLATQRTLLAELESRPLHRAMTAATDIAFVPYDHLASVHPGAQVLSCVWGVFSCRQVGRVAEVLAGEVVTQDPWGELARGEYLILALDEPAAIRERVLRVRD